MESSNYIAALAEPLCDMKGPVLTQELNDDQRLLEFSICHRQAHEKLKRHYNSSEFPKALRM